jgi:hypothetical protein
MAGRRQKFFLALVVIVAIAFLLHRIFQFYRR